MAVAYDNPIPGYNTTTTSNLRLWDAEPITEFDLEAFNSGDYEKVRLVFALYRLSWPATPQSAAVHVCTCIIACVYVGWR